MQNYVAFNKTIGDAALLIFSSFKDIYDWSEKFTANLNAMADEYPENLKIRGVDYDEIELDQRVSDFALRARRLTHLGEVSYKEGTDPLCLAVFDSCPINMGIWSL